jgi:tetratricopeptide (TPR) repeat protein
VLTPERLRIVRRRGFMLFAAMLAAIAVGLLLGRMKQRSQISSVDAADQQKAAVDGPRVSQVARERGMEPELVKPRPAAELLQDASGALMEGNLPRAERLFDKAARAAPERSMLRGEALLGRADALLKLNQKDEAIAIYRMVVNELPKTQKAAEAKTALHELGAPLELPRPAVVRKEAPARREPKEGREQQEKPPSGPPTIVPDIPQEVTASMSPDEKCRATATKYLNDPSGAVFAFNNLAKETPRAACVYRHLAVHYRKLKDDRGELDAFRRYLQLKPDAPDREKVQERIKSLASELEGR